MRYDNTTAGTLMTHGDLILWQRKAVAGSASAVLLAGLLAFGLWPFHAPRNGVSWLKVHDGLQLRPAGVLWTSIDFGSAPPFGGHVLRSIELWLQPDSTDQSATILAFQTADSGYFSVRQWHSDLALQGPTRHYRDRNRWFYTPGVFQRDRAVFVTVVASAQGVALYVDGVLKSVSPRFRFSAAKLAGRIAIGSSTFTDDCWAGQLRGAAIYDRELSPEEAREHFRSWTTTGRLDPAPAAAPLALYTFAERGGNLAHDQGRLRADLVIPERFELLHPVLLEPFWNQFRFEWPYWEDVLVNVAGFVPFGFFLCAYLSQTLGPEVALLMAVCSAAVVSFGIEAVQRFLPTRSSDTTDLITNTLGALAGAYLYRSPSGATVYNYLADGLAVLLPSRSVVERPEGRIS